MKGLNHI